MVAELITHGSAALIGVALAVTTAVQGHNPRQMSLEREATDLVWQIEEVGREVRFHSDRLVEFTDNVGISRWSHYHHLDSIKDLVNDDLRPALKRLNEIQRELPEWKQDSVDRMIAAAQGLSADASSAYFAKNRNQLLPPALNDAYRTFVREVQAHAVALVTTADAAHAYATAHLKASEAGLKVQ